MDSVLKPNHYQRPCSPSTAPVIRRLTGKDPDRYNECKDLILELGLGYFEGAAVKYLWRCEKKGHYIDDLGKAIEHLKERPKSLDRSQVIHEIRELISLSAKNHE